MNPKSDSALSGVESPSRSKQGESKSAGEEKPKEKYMCTEPGCSSIFSRSSKLTRHVRQHTGERPYKCDHAGCTKAYTNSSHLKRHYETHNPVKQTYKCTICALNITNRHNLKRHYERVHKQTSRFSCDACDLTFRKEQKFIEHKATHDGSSLYSCDICKKKYFSLRMFKRHQKTHESKKEYPCTAPDCTEVFGKWSQLCSHMKNKHISQFKCKDCDKVFLNKTHLKSHAVVHSETRSIIPCPYEKCPRFYFFKRNLDHHVRTIHLGKKLECDICKISLSSKQKLIEHMIKIHQPQKKRKLLKKTERSKRKNSGQAKKSMVSKLVGLDLSPEIEKSILKRRSRIKLSKELVESSESEADRERVIKDLEEELRKVLNDVPQNGDLLPLEEKIRSNLEESLNELDNGQMKITGNIDPFKHDIFITSCSED